MKRKSIKTFPVPHPTFLKSMPFPRVGPVELEVGAGDRLVMREAGHTMFDVPNNPDTASIFIRLLYALQNEQTLASNLQQLLDRADDPAFSRPPVKTLVILEAAAAIEQMGGSRTDASFVGRVWKLACKVLKERAAKDPAIAALWKTGRDPVSKRLVHRVLHGKATSKTLPLPRPELRLTLDGVDLRARGGEPR